MGAKAALLIFQEMVFLPSSVRAELVFVYFCRQLSGEIVAKDDREEDVQIKEKNVTRHNYG